MSSIDTNADVIVYLPHTSKSSGSLPDDHKSTFPCEASVLNKHSNLYVCSKNHGVSMTVHEIGGPYSARLLLNSAFIEESSIPVFIVTCSPIEKIFDGFT